MMTRALPALDTNVRMRCIVQDDAVQLASAKQLISRCLGEGRMLFVPVAIVLELEWVLIGSSVGFGKDDVPRTLSRLLSVAELTLDSEGALAIALQLFRKGPRRRAVGACDEPTDRRGG